MAFGGKPARTIANPLIEPLWEGRRVLAHVRVGSAAVGLVGEVELRDEDGLALAGHPDLQAALRAAALAASMILDGYLVAVPPLDAAVALEPTAPDAPTLATVTRQTLVGSRPGGGRRAPSRRSPRSGAPGFGAGRAAIGAAGIGGEVATAVTALVVVDLLALDDEPLLDVPLLERKRLLDSVLAVGELVRRSPHVRPPAGSWYRQWLAYGFRSMAVKDANSHYRPGEASNDWSIAAIPDR